ncbi:Fc.00g048550.m01.CDS01 [Cosmosporella sp. VM-42]
MKLLVALLGLIATPALCTPLEADGAVIHAERAAIATECGALGVMEWNLEDLPEGTNATALRKCKEHPLSLGISSPLKNPAEKAKNLDSSIGKEVSLETPAERDESLIEKRQRCATGGGRGHGADYDYGCDNGWCWRNCNVESSIIVLDKKPWCWLAYEGGHGGWTPCGRWQDCEWSYNNKNAKCGKGNCKACGCGC